MADYKEQKNRHEIEPVSIEKTEKIIEQMKKCVCKIYSNGSAGTGFFTQIPYKNGSKKVLITNNHLLGENEIQNNNIITYIINNNEKDKKEIIIDEKRKRYTNKDMDVTIIEINEYKDDIHDFIETDDDIIDNMDLNKEEIIDNNYNSIYKNESIYILNYMNGENILASYGLITEINEENRIKHKCNINNGSSGSPILSLKNNKLIGIHYDSSDKYEYNLGTLIIYIIIEFNKKENGINEIKNSNINLDANELTIIYKINNSDKRIKLFGKKFIENNKKNCKIIIDNKEQEIIEYIDINKKMKMKNELEIKLKEIKTITNLSYMFGDICLTDCNKLISLPDICNWDTKNVTNMSSMFSSCSSLSSLPDISKWDTKNVINISNLFYSCSSLSALPDISKWDTENVTNMSHMFSNCSSLSSLPDISKWDTKNVINMGHMFSNCSSLSSLPDISRWDTRHVINMSNIFSNCSSLSSLPDISKWETRNVTNMSYMFLSNKLISLPDISKWDTKNVTNMSSMFSNCSLLSSLPDISKWETKNVTNMSYMLYSCSSLSSLPDISKWDNKNVVNMTSMFNNCKSLSSIPDISKWDTKSDDKKPIYMNHMFKYCNKLPLSDIPQIFQKYYS